MTAHPNRSRRAPCPARNPHPYEIRAARRQAGLTAAQAAAMIFVATRTWQQWESGDRRMHPAFWLCFQLQLQYEDTGV
jgi:DNA-binding transcriptional regulator YiaG